MKLSNSAFIRTRFSVVLSATAMLLGVATSAHAQVLGSATDYNAFFFGNASASNVDIGGNVAVGGNANFTNYTIGQDLPASNNVVAVIGGDYTNSNATVNGALIVGGNVVHVNPTIKGDVSAKGSINFSGGGGQVDGNIRYGTSFTGPGYDINGPTKTTTQVAPSSITLPVDFAAAKTDLLAKSSTYGGFSSTLTNLGSFNNVQVNLSSGLNVLNLTAAQLSAMNSFTIQGGTNDTLLINVLDSGAVNVANFGTNFSGGAGVGNLLFNFNNASTINLAGSFNGSLLAPKAVVTGTFGAFNGQLVADRGQIGGVQVNTVINGQNTGFKAKSFGLNVPEPTTVALLGFALPILGVCVRRRR